MAIHGTTGFCSACQKDTVFSRDFGTPDDTPLLCAAGHDHAEFGGTHGMKRTEGTVHEHDPYTYPVEKGVWFRGRPGITPEQARMIQERNKIRAATAKRSKSGGRIKASIPAALFYAHNRINGISYWQDPKNVKRIAKDWAITEDKRSA